MMEHAQVPTPLPQWQADRICSAAGAGDPASLEAAIQQASDSGVVPSTAVNCRDSQRCLTPLHWTSLGGGVGGASSDAKESIGAGKCAALLLALGAVPNAKDANGSSPLHYAVRYNCLPVCQQLLACRRLRLDLRNRWGRTALMFAAWGEAETGGASESGLGGSNIPGGANGVTGFGGGCLSGDPAGTVGTAVSSSANIVGAVVAVGAGAVGGVVGRNGSASVGGGGVAGRRGSVGNSGGGTVGPGVGGGATVVAGGHGGGAVGVGAGRGGGGRGRGSINGGSGPAAVGAVTSSHAGNSSSSSGATVVGSGNVGGAPGRGGGSVSSGSGTVGVGVGAAATAANTNSVGAGSAGIDGNNAGSGGGGGSGQSAGSGGGDRAELARALLGAGASPDVRDSRGRTALMWAALTGKTELLRLLLAANADWRRRNHEGLTAGQLAEREGHSEAARLLKSVLLESLKVPPVTASTPGLDSVKDGATIDGASPSISGTA